MIRPECKACEFHHETPVDWCSSISHGMGCKFDRAETHDWVRPHPKYQPGRSAFKPTPTETAMPEQKKAKDTQVAGDHYKQMGVEPWDVVDTWPLEQRIGAYRHGALKYLMRMGSKDQNAQEIAKGKHYMEKLLEVLREADDEQAAVAQGAACGSIS